MELSEIAHILSTAITTTGAIAVAYFSNRIHKDNRNSEILRRIQKIDDKLDINSRVTISTARTMINAIYTEGKKTKKISEKTWLNATELHDAYKRAKVDGHTPNSWCDSIYDEMKQWEKE